MHALWATMKTLGRATAHLSLIRALTVQACVDDVGDLLDQLLEIAVM
jgi:hypothetical protein